MTKKKNYYQDRDTFKVAEEYSKKSLKKEIEQKTFRNFGNAIKSNNVDIILRYYEDDDLDE